MNENTDIGDAAVLTLPVVALRDIIVFPHMTVNPVSYTHLTLPTNSLV